MHGERRPPWRSWPPAARARRTRGRAGGAVREARLARHRPHDRCALAPGDQVIATNDWTRISLAFYLAEEQVDVRLFNAAASREMALMFLSQHPQGWIASAACPTRRRCTIWRANTPSCAASVMRTSGCTTCRRWHISSLPEHTGERRALLASYGGTLDLTFGPSDAPLLDTRWHDGSVKGDAGIALPLDEPADRDLILDVEPAARSR